MAIPFILLTSFINLITTFSLFLFMPIKAEVISIGHELEAHRNRMRGGISGMQPVTPLDLWPLLTLSKAGNPIYCKPMLLATGRLIFLVPFLFGGNTSQLLGFSAASVARFIPNRFFEAVLRCLISRLCSAVWFPKRNAMKILNKRLCVACVFEKRKKMDGNTR